MGHVFSRASRALNGHASLTRLPPGSCIPRFISEKPGSLRRRRASTLVEREPLAGADGSGVCGVPQVCRILCYLHPLAVRRGTRWSGNSRFCKGPAEPRRRRYLSAVERGRTWGGGQEHRARSATGQVLSWSAQRKSPVLTARAGLLLVQVGKSLRFALQGFDQSVHLLAVLLRQADQHLPPALGRGAVGGAGRIELSPRDRRRSWRAGSRYG